jgi:GNAT superfamily N-acetyltransferase
VPDPITVRRAGPADADAIAAVQVESWRAAYRGIVPDAFLDDLDVAERAARWRDGFTERPERGITWVAEDAGTVVGFVAFGPARDDDASPSVGELQAIYVLSGRWRRGIGTALHDACVAELRRRGFAEATLWTFEANPMGTRFYERCGWAPDGTVVTRQFAGTDLAIARYRRPL